jgi:hypothetical protein
MLQEDNMSGKGSKPRPYSVDQKTFESNWDSIFNKKKKTEQEKFDDAIVRHEYFDILSTEDALVEMMKVSDEMGAYVDEPIDNPLIKK